MHIFDIFEFQIGNMARYFLKGLIPAPSRRRCHPLGRCTPPPNSVASLLFFVSNWHSNLSCYCTVVPRAVGLKNKLFFFWRCHPPLLGSSKPVTWPVDQNRPLDQLTRGQAGKYLDFVFVKVQPRGPPNINWGTRVWSSEPPPKRRCFGEAKKLVKRATPQLSRPSFWLGEKDWKSMAFDIIWAGLKKGSLPMSKWVQPFVIYQSHRPTDLFLWGGLPHRVKKLSPINVAPQTFGGGGSIPASEESP